MTDEMSPREERTMHARMTNPAMVLPDALPAIQALIKATRKAGVPEQTMELVHLRASQINGCSACVAGGALRAKKAGETDERLFAVAAWREAPWFTRATTASRAA
jgi:AhpD family alkylhydroperoxidase